jgi:hypothetical protein
MADLNYRTFDSLMSDVKGGLELYSENNLIKDARYISIAREINSELGIKINQQKEQPVEVEDYKAYLPEDCLSIVGAVAVVGREECAYLDTHNFNLDIHARRRIHFHQLVPSRRSLSKFSSTSFNRRARSQYQIDVQEEEMTFNFKEGRIILFYVSDLIDDDGNLLVLDHPAINRYYEAAIKAEVLKDLWYNMEADTFQKYQNENDRVLPALRQKAKSIVNFPGYKRLKEYSERINREYYKKYIERIV